ncbi:uncharacterized protein LOC143889425 [Tasmannia lanceolata]|uniref:uncharacterized protein LOC143889425 n=1 Tax=Tasmannia lanceolata TaxID=3420 RepID=UPI004062B96F
MFEEYSNEIAEGWSRYANYHHTDRGRIWILWNPSQINFIVHNDSLQHIHGDIVYFHSGIRISVTMVYAKNAGSDKRILWDDLRVVASSINKPWVVAGDFNIVRFCEERYGGPGPIQGDIEDFNSCIFDCYLSDLKALGHTFSWTNKSAPKNLKLRKLDRALVNEEWLCSYPLSLANFKNPGLSDHCPIIIQTLEPNSHDRKPFKFHDMWLEDLSLYEVVEKAWASKFKGNPLFRVTRKLKEVKRCIKI